MVPSTTTLKRLDRILQVAVGWTNSHLHLFHVGEIQYGAPHAEWETEVRDEGRARLSEVAPKEGDRFAYEYDLGDCVLAAVMLDPRAAVS